MNKSSINLTILNQLVYRLKWFELLKFPCLSLIEVRIVFIKHLRYLLFNSVLRLFLCTIVIIEPLERERKKGTVRHSDCEMFVDLCNFIRIH